MPGEMARGLWAANEIAFERTRRKMEQGIRKGEVDCEKLIQLIKQEKQKNLHHHRKKTKLISIKCLGRGKRSP
jgi:hypothetical protein